MADTSEVFGLSALFTVAAIASEVVLNAWMHLDPTGMAFTAKVASAFGFIGGSPAGAVSGASSPILAT